VDCEFDATFFPYKLGDQRQCGYYNTKVKMEELSMFHDMPNATQQDFIARLNSERVPSDATWGLDMVMDKATEIQTVDLTLIRKMPEEERQVYSLRMPAEQQAESGEAEHNALMHNLTIRDLKKTVDVHDHPGVYATVQPTWKDAGCELLQNVTIV